MTKNILFVCCFFYFFGCSSQNKKKELNFKQIGWTLVIPENSDLLTASQYDSLQIATNKKSNLNIELSKNEVLFVFREDAYNFFGSSVTTFDSTKFKSWEIAYTYEKSLIVDLIKSKAPLIVILDSVSSIEKIDGSTFQKFYMKISYPKQNIILENYWYYKKKQNMEISINITFNNNEIGQKYMKLLKSSNFE